MALSQVLNLYKRRGETPLECLQRFRSKRPKYLGIKMTYAGRLDPMAEGVLLVLVGDKIKDKNKILSLDKSYECEVLFGFSTDSFDILGKVIDDAKEDTLKQISKNKILKNSFKRFTGKFNQEYPIFSSKTFKGKSLFEYARGKAQVEVDFVIPKKEIKIYKINKESFSFISKESLFKKIKERISFVKGDFRQEEIAKIWCKKLKNNRNRKFPILKITVFCSSGTYIRSLADKLGKDLFIAPSLAFSIKRLSVGNYTIAKSIK